MNGDRRFSAVAAKARAIYGGRIKPEEWDALINKNNVGQIVAALKNGRRYGKDLAHINELQAHRGQVEYIIAKSVFDIYMKLCGFIPIDTKGFNSFWVKKTELDIIINTIMFLRCGQPEKIIASIPAYFSPHASFDLMGFGKVKNFIDLTNIAEGSLYHKKLKFLLPSVIRDETGFDYESVMRELLGCYYEWLFKCIDKEFSGELREKLREAVTRQINLENISFAYRMSAYFKRPPSEIRDIILPINAGSAASELRQCLSENGADLSLLKILEDKFFRGEAYDRDFIEVAVRKAQQKYFRRLLRASSDGTLVMYGLINLLDIERQNVITVIEGVRYALPPAEIEKLLAV